MSECAPGRESGTCGGVVHPASTADIERRAPGNQAPPRARCRHVESIRMMDAAQSGVAGSGRHEAHRAAMAGNP